MTRKTIALIESLDTKFKEAFFAKQCLEEGGFEVLLIDDSARNLQNEGADVSSEELILASGEATVDDFFKLHKGDRLTVLSKGLGNFLLKLVSENKIHGAISVGGGANMTMVVPAFEKLPRTFPKVLGSSVACGIRLAEEFFGNTNIGVMPTIADVAGLNYILKDSISNCCAMIMGLVEHAKIHDKESGKKAVGATMLGVTTKGVSKALDIINSDNEYEILVFHANGTGGKSLEKLVEEGTVNVVADMTLHEITNEFLGGCCDGAHGRIPKIVKQGIPYILAPGGVDMIDYNSGENEELLSDIDRKRVRMKYNSYVRHCRIFPKEAEMIVREICRRLEGTTAPTTVVVPTKGCCEACAPGGEIYEPEIDRILVETFRKYIPQKVKLVIVDANLCDEEFAQAFAKEFKLLINK